MTTTQPYLTAGHPHRPGAEARGLAYVPRTSSAPRPWSSAATAWRAHTRVAAARRSRRSQGVAICFDFRGAAAAPARARDHRDVGPHRAGRPRSLPLRWPEVDASSRPVRAEPGRAQCRARGRPPRSGSPPWPCGTRPCDWGDLRAAFRTGGPCLRFDWAGTRLEGAPYAVGGWNLEVGADWPIAPSSSSTGTRTVPCPSRVSWAAVSATRRRARHHPPAPPAASVTPNWEEAMRHHPSWPGTGSSRRTERTEQRRSGSRRLSPFLPVVPEPRASQN